MSAAPDLTGPGLARTRTTLGLTQETCRKHYGVGLRSWKRWEADDEGPLPVVARLIHADMERRLHGPAMPPAPVREPQPQPQAAPAATAPRPEGKHWSRSI